MENEQIQMEDINKKNNKTSGGENKMIENKTKKKKGCAPCRKKDSRDKPERKIYMNNPERNKQDKNFCNNYVKTSKYIPFKLIHIKILKF